MSARQKSIVPGSLVSLIADRASDWALKHNEYFILDIHLYLW